MTKPGSLPCSRSDCGMHYKATGTKYKDLYADSNGQCPRAFPHCYTDGYCVVSSCTSWGSGCGKEQYTGTKCGTAAPHSDSARPVASHSDVRGPRACVYPRLAATVSTRTARPVAAGDTRTVNPRRNRRTGSGTPTAPQRAVARTKRSHGADHGRATTGTSTTGAAGAPGRGATPTRPARSRILASATASPRRRAPARKTPRLERRRAPAVAAAAGLRGVAEAATRPARSRILALDIATQRPPALARAKSSCAATRAPTVAAMAGRRGAARSISRRVRRCRPRPRQLRGAKHGAILTPIHGPASAVGSL